MDDDVSALESLVDMLMRQEVGLAELVGLALEEQAALVSSDYPAIERVSAAMIEAAQRLDALDRDRQALAERFGAVQTTATDHLAAHAGADGFAAVQDRLLARAHELRAIQEANARLILSAVKVRERWYGMLAGRGAPTYGAAGRQSLHSARGIVSRSA